MPARALPSFAEAAAFWAQLGFISFGGPAGQIAIMHREVVEQRGWVDEATFTRALNFCMLLPGPEALQLAIFLGWRLHGVRGGLVAGLGFILPAIALLFVLSTVYVTYGHLHWLAGTLAGLQAAVVTLVAQALLRIGRRALDTPLHVALAVGSFIALQLLHVPFPWVLAVAAAAGALGARQSAGDFGPPNAPAVPAIAPYSMAVLGVGIVLWLVPALLVMASYGFAASWSQIYLFFTKAALVTFGGAYAVLGYVNAQLVEQLGWVTAEQAVAGLALAETTPGPLVIVLQFMGFAAGWNEPGPLPPLASAMLAGALAAWATFLPSFVLIFLGAPHVERLTRMPRVGAALAAITAAVVGVIATLAVLLAQVVLFPHGWAAAPDVRALAIAALAWIALERCRWPLPVVLALAAVAGLLTQLA